MAQLISRSKITVKTGTFPEEPGNLKALKKPSPCRGGTKAADREGLLLSPHNSIIFLMNRKGKDAHKVLQTVPNELISLPLMPTVVAVSHCSIYCVDTSWQCRRYWLHRNIMGKVFNHHAFQSTFLVDYPPVQRIMSSFNCGILYNPLICHYFLIMPCWLFLPQATISFMQGEFRIMVTLFLSSVSGKYTEQPQEQLLCWVSPKASDRFPYANSKLGSSCHDTATGLGRWLWEVSCSAACSKEQNEKDLFFDFKKTFSAPQCTQCFFILSNRKEGLPLIKSIDLPCWPASGLSPKRLSWAVRETIPENSCHPLHQMSVMQCI